MTEDIPMLQAQPDARSAAHASLPSSSQAPARLDVLTGVRGVAAWLVVLFHIRMSLETLLPDAVMTLLGHGYLAVDLFFMMSGFVLWYNYADRLRGAGLGETATFIWRRIARIWPLHAFILAVFIAFVVALHATSRHPEGYPVAELLLHLTLTQNWGFTQALSWNHPAWSISTEFGAYLMFPFLVVAARWDRLPTAALIAVIGILLATLHGLFALSGHPTLGGDIPRLGLARCLLEFTIGALLCPLALRWRTSASPRRMLFPGVICAAILGGGVLAGWPQTVVAPAAFATGLLALTLDRSWAARVLSAGPLRYLGEISYSTYLAHYLLFILFKVAFVDATLQIGWLALAGFLTIVFAASAALYHGVELPAQRWLNRNRPFRRRAPPQTVSANDA